METSENNHQSILYIKTSFLIRLFGLERGSEEPSMDKFNFENVRRWNNDIFEFRHIFIAINLQNVHYALVHINTDTKVIQYYDSLHWSTGQIYVDAIKKYLQLKWENLYPEVPFDSNEWTTIPHTEDMPIQSQLSNNCGIYVCLLADRLSVDAEYSDLSAGVVNQN